MAKKIGAIILAFLGTYRLYLGAYMKADHLFYYRSWFIIISLFYLSKK